jgi:hypothetical protein
MTIHPDAAARFTKGYALLLLTIAGEKHSRSILEGMVVGRTQYLKNPGLLNKALKSVEVEEAVVNALRSLRVDLWLYLRDTSKHAIFIDSEESAAFAVLGLNSPVSEIIGGSGAFIRTGMVQFEDRFVCDGLIQQVVWLGSGIRGSAKNTFRDLKAAGQFFKTP